MIIHGEFRGLPATRGACLKGGQLQHSVFLFVLVMQGSPPARTSQLTICPGNIAYNNISLWKHAIITLTIYHETSYTVARVTCADITRVRAMQYGNTT
nr:hypothetical protein GZ35D7_25 [uncultured archaeon GZfos35D7]